MRVAIHCAPAPHASLSLCAAEPVRPLDALALFVEPAAAATFTVHTRLPPRASSRADRKS